MIINGFGFLMLIWYAAYRWTMLGTEVGKIITDIHGNETFALNWWFAPINLMTAFISVPFLIISLFTPEPLFIKYQLLSFVMYIIGLLLLLRNVYYTVEDVQDYIYMIKHPNQYTGAQIKQQLLFVIIDIMMAIYCYYMVIKYKGIM